MAWTVVRGLTGSARAGIIEASELVWSLNSLNEITMARDDADDLDLSTLEDRVYSAIEVAELLGRNKSRIHQLSRQFGLGTEVRLTPTFLVKQYSRNDILWLAKWFEENGKPQSERGKALDRQYKPDPKSGRKRQS